jgi:hypothetical protein
LPVLASPQQFPVYISILGNFRANDALSGLKGAINHANVAMYNLDETHSTPGCVSVANASLILVAGYGQKLEMLVTRAYDFY